MTLSGRMATTTPHSGMFKGASPKVETPRRRTRVEATPGPQPKTREGKPCQAGGQKRSDGEVQGQHADIIADGGGSDGLGNKLRGQMTTRKGHSKPAVAGYGRGAVIRAGSVPWPPQQPGRHRPRRSVASRLKGRQPLKSSAHRQESEKAQSTGQQRNLTACVTLA